MTTKLYLHATSSGIPSGTLPTTEQSTLTVTSGGNFEADQSTNRLMNTTIGASQANLSKLSIADTNANNYYIGRWVSPIIYQSQITAQTWTVEYAAKESNAAANFPRSSTGAMYTNIYVWKPSNGTKVGTVIDGNSNADGEEASTTQTVINYTLSGAAVTGITPGDACIVVEIWAQVTQGNGTQRTDDFYYDGTTENSTTSEAAFISTPENISFTQTPWNASPCYAAHAANTTASTANTTQYWSCIGGSDIQVSTTESDVQTIFRSAGEIGNFQVYLSANSIAGNTTFTLRKNATTDLTSTVTFGASVTGLVEDVTHRDSIAAGDKIDCKSVPGAATNTFTPRMIGGFFAGSTKNVQKFATSGSRTISSASSTNYFTLNGNPGQAATEANTKIRFRQPGTLKNMSMNIQSNARTTTTTFSTRKNGTTAGNLSVAVGSGVSGFVEDTSNSDAVVDTDDWNHKTVTGTGTENLVITGSSIEFEKTNDDDLAVCYAANGLGAAVAISTTTFMNIYGHNRWNTTENNAKVLWRSQAGDTNFSLMYAYVSANTITATSTLTFRKNGANGNNTIAITSGTTGLVSDVTPHSDNVLEGDRVNFQLVTGGTGTDMTILTCGIQCKGKKITQSSTLKYNILSRVTLSRIYKYHLLGRISLSCIYKYHVQARVTLSRIYKYHVLGRISLSRIYKYHLLGRISLSRVYKYNIQSRISLSRIYLYNVQARVSLSRIYKYHVANLVSLSRTYKYHVLGRISLSRIYLYNIIGRVSLSKIYKYNIQSRISLSRIYKYNIMSRVSLSSILKYNILQRISLSSIYKYNIQSRVSLARTYLYNVIGRISQSSIFKYNIQQRVSLARTYLWNVLVDAGLTRISKDQTYLWNVIGRISLSRTYKYHVLGRVSLDRIYKYHVLNRVTLSRTYLWNVIGRISLSRIYRYNILSRVSLSKTYKYHITNIVSKAQTYKFNVIGRVTLSRIYKYNIIGRISKTSIIKYNILNRITLSKIYKWNIANRVSKQLTIVYNILHRISIDTTLRWNFGADQSHRDGRLQPDIEGKRLIRKRFNYWKSYWYRDPIPKRHKQSKYRRG